MSIVGINAITYGANTAAECERFFADWGLMASRPKGEGLSREWRTMNGARVIVCPENAAHLPAPMEAGATLRGVEWAVSAASPLIGKTVVDPNGLQSTFALDARTPISVKGSPSNPWGAEARVDAPSPVYERATPIEIGHVVLFVENIHESEAFYVNLGFVVSDRYPGRGVFLRGTLRGGHHDLFLLQVPGKAKGLNHIAFTVRDIHEVFGGGLHMSRCGWKTQLGPGRHPISSAYFWYFECPAGGLIEYNADEDHLTENWKPREFQPGPTMFAEWAIDGGIDGHTRRQPNAQASGKFLTEKR
jgi:catechol 2,3-dioxygenase-like lactoylglutathione lyase family enzyme